MAKGLIPEGQALPAIEHYKKLNRKWGDAARAIRAAIAVLEEFGPRSTQAEEAASEADRVWAEAEGKEAEDPEEEEEKPSLEELAEEAAIAARRRAAAEGLPLEVQIYLGQVAYNAVMAGASPEDAAKKVEETLEEAAAKDPTGFIPGILSTFGQPGALGDDAGIGAKLSGPFNAFLKAIGLTPEALEEVTASPLDREKASQLAKGITAAAVGGVSLLHTIGIVAEIASLGQVEGVTHAIDGIIQASGIGPILASIFALPFDAALVTPARQYWMSVYRPTVPPIQDLRLMAVREAFPVETREEQFSEMARWGAYHGLAKYWMGRYLAAGYERMGVPDAIRAFRWRRAEITRRLLDGDVTAAEAEAMRVDTEAWLRGFLSIADIHPDDHAEILRALWTLPTRYERRHGYIMGVYGRKDLVEMFQKDGQSEETAESSMEAMVAYALNSERNAVARAAGRIYRETLETVAARLGAGKITGKVAIGLRKRAEVSLRKRLEELQITGERQDLWVARYRMESLVAIKPWEEWEELAVVPEEAG